MSFITRALCSGAEYASGFGLLAALHTGFMNAPRLPVSMLIYHKVASRVLLFSVIIEDDTHEHSRTCDPGLVSGRASWPALERREYCLPRAAASSGFSLCGCVRGAPGSSCPEAMALLLTTSGSWVEAQALSWGTDASLGPKLWRNPSAPLVCLV